VPTHEATEFARRMTDRPAAQAGSGGEEEARQLPADPVCVEVPVRIHGSEVTSPVPGVTVHSELFHEETRTLIVFPRGAVVRLSASVTQGQALVLTNLRTNQEMPCRVVSVRNSANVEDYVELEFTRGAPGFWGVNFSPETSSAAAPARPAASPEPKFEAPAVAVPPSSFKKVSDSKRPVADTYSSKATPSVKFPAESPIRASTPVRPAAIVGTKKEDPPAGHTPAVEVTPRAIVVEPPLAGPAPSQEVFSLSQTTKAPTEVSTPVKASAPAELKIEEPPATGSSDQEPAGVSSEAEVAALVSETISLLAAAEAKAKQSPVRSIPPAGAAARTGKERESVARPSTADSLPVSLERTAWGAKTAHEDTSAAQSLAARLAGHLAARKAAAERSPLGKLTLVFASVSVFAMVLGGGWLLFRHHSASGTATSVTQDAIPVQTPEPTEVASQSAPANESPATQPQVSVAAERQASMTAPPPAPAAPKEHPKQSANDLRISPAVSKLSSRFAPPKSVAVPREAPPVPSIGSEVLDVVPDGQSNSVVGAVVPGVSRPGLALTLPPPAPGQVPPRVGGQVKEPRLVSVVKPVYPAIARQGLVEGDVVVETEIDATGKVTRMKVLSGPALLHQAAMNALRNWRYEPAMLDGQALAVQMRVTVKFHLR
jgi:periplasmic protein TonB